MSMSLVSVLANAMRWDSSWAGARLDDDIWTFVAQSRAHPAIRMSTPKSRLAALRSRLDPCSTRWRNVCEGKSARFELT
jgi:hypothetical protein